MSPREKRWKLVARLIQAEVMGGDQVETDSYFDTSRFLFHRLVASRRTTAGLTTVRAAFKMMPFGASLSSKASMLLSDSVEEEHCRGVGAEHQPPSHRTSKRVVWDLSDILPDEGRLVEEWVRTDYQSFQLRQLGTEGR